MHISNRQPIRRPRRINPGQLAEELTIWLRLKLIADAGIVGLPNAGKSTFLAAVSAAKPKIADYPFTTLHPNLGVVRAGEKDFVIADIPGLIEGANEGVGLGTRFLGHVERCHVLLHLVDVNDEDVAESYRTIRQELEAYGGNLGDKTEIVALSKCDTIDEETYAEKALCARRCEWPGAVASVGGVGVWREGSALSSGRYDQEVGAHSDRRSQAIVWDIGLVTHLMP